jgi:hypothetical protein
VNPTTTKRFSLRAALVAASLACLIGTLEAQQAVSWTNYRNVAVRGSSLEKTGGCEGCDDAGAVSRQTIESGDGFVEFMAGEDYSFWMAGLSRLNGNANFGNIDFAVRLNGNGRADIVEKGTYVGGDTEYRANDGFRVEVANGVVRYLKNGQLLHVSQRRAAYPLVLDVALGSIGSTIRNARIDSRASGATTLGWLEGP